MALRGLPGVGKTALALALANREDVAAAFPDGRAWLSLGPQPDVFGLLGRLLEMFGATGQDLLTVEARADRLRVVLDGRRYLLILDDVWKAHHARPFLEAVRPPARALFTTRYDSIADDLHASNHEVRVLQPKYAVDMLRLAGADAAATVAADEQGAAELAEALGRLPLALHVAGRRLERLASTYGPRDAVARLRRELDRKLLELRAAERRPGIEVEEPSLEAILALSYDALPDDTARAAFRRLAVFGSQPLNFDAAAMAAVWGVDEDAATDLLLALRDAGLLEVTSETPNRRYALHQVIARYAAALLAGDPAEMRASELRHARHYVTVVADWDKAIAEGRMTYSAPLEWENVVVALQRLASATPEDDEAAGILVAYSHHWRNVLYNNHDRRRLSWLNAAVEAAWRFGDSWDLANVLQAQGDVLAFLDRRDEALARYEQALGLFRAVGDRLGEANVLKAQGDGALRAGDVEAGMALLDQARRIYSLIGDRVGLSNVGIILARYAASRGDWAAAIRYMQPAADFCKEIGHPLGEQLQQEIEQWRSRLEEQQQAVARVLRQ